MAKNKLVSVKLTPEDVEGHYWVTAKLSPKTAQDKMLQSQIAQTMRNPNRSGIPLMSDTDIVSKVLQEPHPEEIINAAEMQVFVQNNPDAMKLREAALLAEWKDQNKELVRAAEKELNPPDEEQDKEFEKFKKSLTKEKFKEMIVAMAQLEHAKQMGQDPNQMMGAMQAAQAAGASMNERMSMLPATVQAPQPPPTAMPSQMSMPDASAQTGANPDQLVVEQMKRGKAHNMHKG